MTSRWTTLLTRWWVVLVTAMAGLAVILGGFDVRRGIIWLGVLAAVGLTTGILQDARWRLAVSDAPERPWAASEGPLLWITGAWAITRLGGGYGPYLILVPVALVAFLLTMFPRRVQVRVIGAVIILELGLLFAGRIAPVELLIRALLMGGATLGLGRLSRWSAWRADVAEQRADRAKAEANQDARRAFGLLTAQAPAISALPGADIASRPTVGQAALDHVNVVFQRQVQLLREALGARMVAVLWRTEDDQLRLRTWDGDAEETDAGPWPSGTGIPATVLREGKAVAVAPVHPGGLPYHAHEADIGAVYATPLYDEAADDAIVGVLCVDSEAPLSRAAHAAVDHAAAALMTAVTMSRALKAKDLERTIVQRICAALTALNGSLGLDAATSATLEAVELLVKPDLVALSVVRGDVHVILGARGDGAAGLKDLQFTGDEGLVGQAVAHGRIMPLREPRRTKGVFTAEDTLEAMRSLLVVPLTRADGEPVGALTVGARAEGYFVAHRRDMLALIAKQLGIKLDLAQAHDRLRGLATVDGLTGLNNHRTFQQGLDQMIARARRRESPVCLLLVDIDHFKRLNDTYGHPFGDTVLRAVSGVISRTGRAVDLSARYGGEEFAVVLEDSDGDGGRGVAERIRARIESLRFEPESVRVPAPDGEDGADASDPAVRVTVSVGLASLPSDATTKAALIELADKALYAAKHRGRNQVQAWVDVASS